MGSVKILCERCGCWFIQAGRGRTPRFCSTRCRVAANRARPKLPAEMTGRIQWTARDGKRPVQADGKPASSTNASTWSSYESVKHLPHGIMLGGGLACWDLDHCLDGTVLTPWAREVVDQISPDSVVWSERSMSGAGVHVFVRAPESPGKVRVVGGGRVEFYTRARFIAVTADHLKLDV